MNFFNFQFVRRTVFNLVNLVYYPFVLFFLLREIYYCKMTGRSRGGSSVTSSEILVLKFELIP